MSAGLRPAAIDDGERVDEFGFPIAAAARLAPGERGQRRNHRPHVFPIDDDVAEGRLHAPQAEHDVTVDAVVPLDPRQQADIFLGALLAGDDAPVGAAPVDVLPDLFGEFRLRVVLGKHAGVGRERGHDAVVGRLRNAALDRAGAETGDPTGEGGRLRGKRCTAERQARACAQRERQAGAAGHGPDRSGDLAGGDSRHGGSLCAAACGQ